MTAQSLRCVTATVALTGMLGATPARADAVLEWNALLQATVSTQNPFAQARLAALTQLAVFTAVSMTIVTTGFGAVLSVRSVAGSLAAAAPVLGTLSLAFGVWYAAAAWSLAPYPF